MISHSEAVIIVNDYINQMIKFLSVTDRDYMIMMNLQYGIDEIMFIIGYYNLTDELKKIQQNTQIQNYYSVVNIYYNTIIAAIHKNNKEIYDILNIDNTKYKDYNDILKSYKSRNKINNDFYKYLNLIEI